MSKRGIKTTSNIHVYIYTYIRTHVCMYVTCGSERMYIHTHAHIIWLLNLFSYCIAGRAKHPIPTSPQPRCCRLGLRKMGPLSLYMDLQRCRCILDRVRPEIFLTGLTRGESF